MPYTAAQLTSYFRAASFGQTPDAATLAIFTDAAARNAGGTLSDQAALALAVRAPQVRATTDVAVGIYQYFNLIAPSQAGLNYLINTPGSGLNTPYYNGAGGTASNPGPGGFNLENRFYNLAISQAFQGSNSLFFLANYSIVNLQQAVVKAYEEIVGREAVITFPRTGAIASIQAQIPYFQQIAAERAGGFDQDFATKAVIVGYIMQEAFKAGVGIYARAVDQHIAAIANDTAVYGANILIAYAPGAPAYGAGVGHGTLATTLGPSPLPTQLMDLPANALVHVQGHQGDGLSLKLKDASAPGDQITVVLFAQDSANGTTIQRLSLGGAAPGEVESLNLVSMPPKTEQVYGAENVTVLDPATAPYSVTITGTQSFKLVTGALKLSMTINGLAATGSLILDASEVVTPGVSLTLYGGRAGDTIKPGRAEGAFQTIQPSLGGDAILLDGGVLNPQDGSLSGPLNPPHASRNTISYGVAIESLYSDSLQVGSMGLPFDPTAPQMDAIYGFRSGQDRLKLSSLSPAEMVVADKGVVPDTAAFAALRASADFYKSADGATRRLAVVHKGADLFLFFDHNKNGVFDAGADIAIKLVGLAALAAGDISF